jgi:transmembrane sensor
MEEKNSHSHLSSPKEDRKLWEDILNGKQSDAIPSLLDGEKQEMWQNILNEIRVREYRKNQKRIRIFSVAAAVILLLTITGVIGYHTITKPDTYFAESGTENILLGDGSKVSLLKGAKLTVAKSFPASTREVFLEGNAIFHVAKSKNHPFIVHANGYQTKVLGTIFRISQRGKTFIVNLFEGKVLVYKTGLRKDPVALLPQQTFNNYGVSEAGAVIKTVKKNDVNAKDRTAAMTFNECPIRDAILVVEKTYGIKVLYPQEIGDTKITISLPEKTAAIFLQTLAIQLNLNIKQRNDSIFELEK